MLKAQSSLLETSTLASESEPQMASEDLEMVLVADLVYANGQVHLVEINKFGGETGCGSSLFHWKRDEDILYGDGKEVIGRFLTRD